MPPIVHEIEINRPPDEVVPYVTDPTRFADCRTTWSAEVTPPLSLAARGLEGSIRAHARITVEPLRDGAASRVAFALDFEGPGIGRLFVPQVRRIAAKQAPHSYQNLKRRLESRA